ncbi:hypothetical protein RU92_GL001021 [Lactococcus cremoris subsp. tructae]|uniref:Uncharacterized protein n=2 Tax=Lactococcus lactis subsp. cremoris TaxID=1359 RepID=A0A2A5SQJ1_LACLC|nr:hypothetical protein RU92_GL001021 [Lactococcus cremoris subsp. tructae]
MRFFAAFLKTGVVMSFKDGLRVRSAQNGMNIQVGSGSAVIDGGSYLNDEAIGIQVNVASSIQERMDSVVLRMDRNARATQLFYKPGDTTVARNDTTYELQLATISVKTNATQITDADITDMRSDPTVCGWSTPFDNINVDGIVDQYKQIFEQKDLEFQAWFQNLKNQLDDKQAANLQNQIDAINGVIVQKDIPEEANLDDYKTEGEFSKKTPTIVSGAPDGVTGAFRLSVRTMLGSSGIFQTIYDYVTRSIYYRIGNITLGFDLAWQKVATDLDDVPWTDLTPGTGVLVPNGAYLRFRIKNGYITIVASNVQTTIDANGSKLLTTLPVSLFGTLMYVGTAFTGNSVYAWRVGINKDGLYVAGTSGLRSNYVSFSVTLPLN